MPNEENRPEMTAAELSEQEQIRRGKLAALTEAEGLEVDGFYELMI